MAPAMFQVDGEARWDPARKACPRAYKKLDRGGPRFGHGAAQKLVACQGARFERPNSQETIGLAPCSGAAAIHRSTIYPQHIHRAAAGNWGVRASYLLRNNPQAGSPTGLVEHAAASLAQAGAVTAQAGRDGADIGNLAGAEPLDIGGAGSALLRRPLRVGSRGEQRQEQPDRRRAARPALHTRKPHEPRLHDQSPVALPPPGLAGRYVAKG